MVDPPTINPFFRRLTPPCPPLSLGIQFELNIGAIGAGSGDTKVGRLIGGGVVGAGPEIGGPLVGAGPATGGPVVGVGPWIGGPEVGTGPADGVYPESTAGAVASIIGWAAAFSCSC